jgi:hypothetical protein
VKQVRVVVRAWLVLLLDARRAFGTCVWCLAIRDVLVAGGRPDGAGIRGPGRARSVTGLASLRAGPAGARRVDGAGVDLGVPAAAVGT